MPNVHQPPRASPSPRLVPSSSLPCARYEGATKTIVRPSEYRPKSPFHRLANNLARSSPPQIFPIHGRCVSTFVSPVYRNEILFSPPLFSLSLSPLLSFPSLPSSPLLAVIISLCATEVTVRLNLLRPPCRKHVRKKIFWLRRLIFSIYRFFAPSYLRIAASPRSREKERIVSRGGEGGGGQR